jgi:hypothetical protein
MVLHGRSFWAPAQTLVGQQSLPCAHTRKPLLRSINSIRAVLLAFLVTALVVAVEPSGLGQMDAGSAISGQVLNALTGQPVSRALVRLDGQAVLADHEGKFEISGVTREIISIQVTKPGFYERLEPGRGNLGQQIKVTTLSGPVVIRLYPEALITGTVTTSPGSVGQVLGGRRRIAGAISACRSRRAITPSRFPIFPRIALSKRRSSPWCIPPSVPASD